MLPYVNANRYRPTQAAALSVSTDAMGAALLAAAIEVAGMRAGFPMDGESPRDAVRRMRPSHVLIDCGDANASDESLIGPAMMTGARVFLFGDERGLRMSRHIALRFHMGIVVLPNDVDRLAAILALPTVTTPAPEPLA